MTFGDEKYSLVISLVCLAFLFSVHNLIAPNLTAVSQSFKMNPNERDEYLGGALTLAFYGPGTVVALLFGFLTGGLVQRKTLYVIVICITAVACFCTTFVNSYSQLALTRAMTGIGVGGALPIIYSMVPMFTKMFTKKTFRYEYSKYITILCYYILCRKLLDL